MTTTGRRGYVGIDRRWLANSELSDSALRLMLWLDSHTHEYLRDLSVKRIAAEIDWSRNRVKRTLDDLTELGLVTCKQVPHADPNKTRTRVTLHHEVWSDGAPERGPRQTPGGVHGEAQGGVHGEAPTTSTPIEVETQSQELVVPAETTPVGSCTFDDWYTLWPKKQGKATARQKWRRLSTEDRCAAMAAIPAWQRYAREHPQGAQYVPMASTFLNQRRWEDDPPALPANPNVRQAASTDAMTRFLNRHQPTGPALGEGEDQRELG